MAKIHENYHIPMKYSRFFIICSAPAERVLGTSSRYTTKNPLILLQIQPTPHFKIHKDVIRLLIVSRPPSDNFNDRDTSFRTSRKTENTKYGLFYTFYRLPSTKRRQ